MRDVSRVPPPSEMKFFPAAPEAKKQLLDELDSAITIIHWSVDKDPKATGMQRMIDSLIRQRNIIEALLQDDNPEVRSRCVALLERIYDLDPVSFRRLQGLAGAITSQYWKQVGTDYQAMQGYLPGNSYKKVILGFIRTSRRRREHMRESRDLLRLLQPQINKFIENGMYSAAEEFLEHSFVLYKKEEKEALQDELAEIVKSKIAKKKHMSIFFATTFLTKELSFGKAFGEHVISRMVDSYGVKGSELVAAWKKGVEQKDYATYVSENIQRIHDLERRFPGGTRLLHENFGIRHFARYPVNLLIEQCKTFNTHMPYGVALMPVTDHNGAFSDKYDLWASLQKDLSNQDASPYTYGIRIVEAETVNEVARHLIHLRSLYDNDKNREEDRNKISFSLIGGHGTQDSIEFGGKDGIHNLRIEHLQGSGTYRSRDFFVPRPLLVLWSCSTGKIRGIGQRLSRSLRADVFGPNEDASIKNLSLIKNGEGLDCKIIYQASVKNEKGEHIRYVRVPTFRYRGGNLFKIS